MLGRVESHAHMEQDRGLGRYAVQKRLSMGQDEDGGERWLVSWVWMFHIKAHNGSLGKIVRYRSGSSGMFSAAPSWGKCKTKEPLGSVRI